MNCYIVGISSNLDDCTIRVFPEEKGAEARDLARSLAEKLQDWELESDNDITDQVPEWATVCNIRSLDISTYCCTYLHTIREGVLVAAETFDSEDFE